MLQSNGQCPVYDVGLFRRQVAMEESEDPNLPRQEFMQRLLEIPEICKEKSLALVSTVGPYELLEEIGRGGMGTVHTARDTRNGQIVALKLMSSLDPQFRARFRLEAANLVRAAKGVASEYVVRPLEASSEGEVPHIAMEYVKGTSLSERITESVRERKPIAVTEACHIMRQVAIGLGHLHDQSIIHRDIKPSNLICTDAGRVRILDFGIAKFVGSQEDTSENTGMTENHQILGTQEYMAPELFGGNSNLTERSDIYSLGATFYKLLTGFAPYRETEASRSESIAYSHAHRKITPVQHLRPDTPDRLAGIIHKMLSPRPANRYRTAQEVAAALDQFLEAPHRSRSQLKPALICGLASLMCLLGVILTIQNKSGTIEISSPDGKLPDDVKISVRRDGHEVEVLQKENNWTASVRNGEVQLDVRGGNDDFLLEQNSIVVKRFGKSIVSLKQRPVPVLQQPSPIEVGHDDRAMAEIIIRNGGRVSIVPVGTSPDHMSDAATDGSPSQPLLQAPFWLFQASIPQVPDDEPNFIASLLKMPHLHVAAFGAGIRDEDFDEAIPTGDSSLCVRFDESKVTGRTLQQMAKWQNLTEIHFGTMPHIEDNDLAALRDMQSLRTLDLRGTSVTDSGLQHLRNLEKLNELWLDGRPVSSAGLNALQGCKSLNYLSLAECSEVDDQGLAICRSTPHLLSLNLADTSVTDVGLLELGQLAKFETLTLDGLPVTGEGLEYLNDCISLTNLSLQRCTAMNTREVSAVCRIKTLRRLYLSGTEIDDGAIKNVCRELPELELLHLAVNKNCKIVPTAQILEPLIAMTKLADLDLSGNSSITDDCVPALGQMKQLLKLNISKTAITEDGFAQLKLLLPTTEITGP
jgi:serine/threonine protein kinase